MSNAYVEAMEALRDAEQNGDIQQAFAGENKAAATRVRKAFLKAKKAFHEGRQDLQAIKKGDQDPVDVPTFFSSDEE
ncbi:MAG: hypothetical protein ACQEVA_19125 [Myxococcota bacterium]